MIESASGTLWLMAHEADRERSEVEAWSLVTSLMSTVFSRPCSSSLDLAKASVSRLA